MRQNFLALSGGHNLYSTVPSYLYWFPALSPMAFIPTCATVASKAFQSLALQEIVSASVTMGHTTARVSGGRTISVAFSVCGNVGKSTDSCMLKLSAALPHDMYPRAGVDVGLGYDLVVDRAALSCWAVKLGSSLLLVLAAYRWCCSTCVLKLPPANPSSLVALLPTALESTGVPSIYHRSCRVR